MGKKQRAAATSSRATGATGATDTPSLPSSPSSPSPSSSSPSTCVHFAELKVAPLERYVRELVHRRKIVSKSERSSSSSSSSSSRDTVADSLDRNAKNATAAAAEWICVKCALRTPVITTSGSSSSTLTIPVHFTTQPHHLALHTNDLTLWCLTCGVSFDDAYPSSRASSSNKAHAKSDGANADASTDDSTDADADESSSVAKRVPTTNAVIRKIQRALEPLAPFKAAQPPSSLLALRSPNASAGSATTAATSTSTTPATAATRPAASSPSSASLSTTFAIPTFGPDDTLPSCGLTNLGNTCFFNSVMQCLSATRPLLAQLARPDLKLHDNTHPILHAFGTCVAEMLRSTDVHSPGRLLAAIARNNPMFRGRNQQDAHELLRLLIGGIASEVDDDVRRKRTAAIVHVVKTWKSDDVESFLRTRVTLSPECAASLLRALDRGYRPISLPVALAAYMFGTSRPEDRKRRTVVLDALTADERIEFQSKLSTLRVELIRLARQALASDAADGDVPADDVTFLNQALAGNLQPMIQCKHCGNVSRTDELFYDLSLPIEPPRIAAPIRLADIRKQQQQHVSSVSGASASASAAVAVRVNFIVSSTGEVVVSFIDAGECSSSATSPSSASSPSSSTASSSSTSSTSTSAVDEFFRIPRLCGTQRLAGDCTLTDCLAAFFDPEPLTGENRYVCSKCSRTPGSSTVDMRDAIRRVAIRRAPNVLTLHLKRFSAANLRLMTKVNKHVAFPAELDLSPFLLPAWLDKAITESSTATASNASSAEASSSSNGVAPADETVTSAAAAQVAATTASSCRYRLYGVVNHSGGMAGGHYIAFARKNPSSWMYFSDSLRRPARESDVLQAQAFLLMYERIE